MPAKAAARPPGRDALAAVKLWLFFSAACTVLGWVLSALGLLSAVGWLFLVAVLWLPGTLKIGLPRLRWATFRRPLPLLFLALAALVFLRGFFNDGGYTEDVDGYRLPRILHWLAEHTWHWIRGIDARLNTRATGFEWMATPFLMLGWEHGIFLLTTISFWLLPSVTFVALREMGVARRAAWAWMWLVPTGYCYLWQAGTLSTDGMGAFYSLAAVGLALRARRVEAPALAGWALIAAGLLTNQKASNLPLLLPFAVAWWPNLRLFRGKAAQLAVIIFIAALVSFLPIALANHAHTGSILGLSAEESILKPISPLVALGANAILVASYALAPPYLFLGQTSGNVFDLLHLPALQEFLALHFEEGFGVISRAVNQVGCGLGLGITTLALWGAVLAWKARSEGGNYAAAVRWMPWLALAALMAKSTLFALPRVLAPYYPLLLPALLAGAGGVAMTRSPWWRRLAVLNSGACILLILLTTDTPPWPVRTVVDQVQRSGLQSSIARSFVNSYGASTRLRDFYRSFAETLPQDEKVIGLVRHWRGGELYYWRPLGSRVVTQISSEENGVDLRARGIQHVVVSKSGEPVEKIAARLDAEVISVSRFIHPRIEGFSLYLLKVRPAQQ